VTIPRSAPALIPAPRFADAVRDHQPMLAELALRLCGEPANAKDLVQDTFERALRAWDRLRPDSNIRGWLATILHRLFVDRCRRAVRVAAVDVDRLEPRGPEPAAAPPVWASLTPAQLRRAIARLDDEFRTVYRLHAIERKSYKHIAAQLGIPPATVGTRLLRARRKLKHLLDELCSAAGPRAARRSDARGSRASQPRGDRQRRQHGHRRRGARDPTRPRVELRRRVA